MKKIIVIIIVLSSFTVIAQNNSFSEEEHTRLLTKVQNFLDEGLFTDIYNRNSYFACSSILSQSEIQSRIDELLTIKQKWEKPNGDIAEYNANYKALNDYVDIICRNIGSSECSYFSRGSNRLNTDILPTWQRKYDDLNKCLGNSKNGATKTTSTNSYNSKTLSYKSSTTTRENNDQLTNLRKANQQGQKRLKAANAAIDNLASLFVPKQKDRSGEAIIKDQTSSSKAIVSRWELEYNIKKKEVEQLEKQRLDQFKTIVNDSTNITVLNEALKHYSYGVCPNQYCKNGELYEHQVQLCSSCGGATFHRVGVYIHQGQTKHPNDGKELCKKCDAAGVVEKQVNTREKCDRCHGYHNKALIYTGSTASISQELAVDMIRYMPKVIKPYMEMKTFFEKNPEAPYYYKLYDDGESYTNIRFWNKELDEFQPNNIDEEIKKIFERKLENQKKAQKIKEEYNQMMPQERLRGSRAWSVGKLKGSRKYIINNKSEKEIIQTEVDIDSAFVLPKMNLLITHHTTNSGRAFSVMYNSALKIKTSENYRLIGYEMIDEYRQLVFYSYNPNDSDTPKTLMDNLGHSLKYFPERKKTFDNMITKWKAIKGSDAIIVELKSGKKGIINYLFYKVMPPKFDDFGIINAAIIKEGLIPAKSKGKWGFVDKYGRTVIKFKYQIPNNQDNIYGFVDGKTTVGYKGTNIEIDTKGKTIK